MLLAGHVDAQVARHIGLVVAHVAAPARLHQVAEEQTMTISWSL